MSLVSGPMRRQGTGCLGTSQGKRLGILQINGLSMWVSNDSPLVGYLMIASGVLETCSSIKLGCVPAQLSKSVDLKWGLWGSI